MEYSRTLPFLATMWSTFVWVLLYIWFIGFLSGCKDGQTEFLFWIFEISLHFVVVIWWIYIFDCLLKVSLFIIRTASVSSSRSLAWCCIFLLLLLLGILHDFMIPFWFNFIWIPRSLLSFSKSLLSLHIMWI